MFSRLLHLFLCAPGRKHVEEVPDRLVPGVNLPKSPPFLDRLHTVVIQRWCISLTPTLENSVEYFLLADIVFAAAAAAPKETEEDEAVPVRLFFTLVDCY